MVIFGRNYTQYTVVLCPLCETRRAKRHCPARGDQICAVCCGTKRLTEIACPPDCPYLSAAREHPAAVVVRQQRDDVGFVMQSVRDFSDRQSQLFVLIGTFIVRSASDAASLHTLVDEDVADAMRSLAATYETSVRGVIYEHPTTSLPAQRLVSALKPLLVEAGKNGGTAFERDAAVVLRRIEQAVSEVQAAEGNPRRAFIVRLERIFSKAAQADAPDRSSSEEPRLIVP
jgi:hypothetical protein